MPIVFKVRSLYKQMRKTNVTFRHISH